MLTFQELQAKFPFRELVESEWHQHPNGGGWVENTASVYGSARVSGNAWEFSPLQIQGSKHFINFASHTELQIGCHKHTVEFWLKEYKNIGKREDYTPAQIKEYGLILKLCAAWQKLMLGGSVENV